MESYVEICNDNDNVIIDYLYNNNAQGRDWMHDKDTKLYYSNLTPSFASDTSHEKAVIFIQFS